MTLNKLHIRPRHKNNRYNSTACGLEYGRSMVEMLGVLVIVGVLSIGGILGYRFAVDKYKVNEIIGTTTQFTVSCAALKEGNPNGDCNTILDEMGLTEWAFFSDPDFPLEFEVDIPDVSQNVCRQIVTVQWPLLVNILSDGVDLNSSADNCAKGDSVLTLVLTPSPSDCTSRKKCGNTCCYNSTSTCDGDVCILENTCPESTPLRDNGGKCFPCDTRYNISGTGPETCMALCPKRYLHSNGVSCSYCPEGSTFVGYYCQPTCSEGEVVVYNNSGSGSKSGRQFARCCPEGTTKLENQECAIAPQACNSIDGCPDGKFCNFGGTNTPDICMPANPQTAVINGTTYYFNTAGDLFSWCRGADNGSNCTWGFLSRSGANSWCKAIGKSLLTQSELLEAADDLSKVLPWTERNNANYWCDSSGINMTTKKADTTRADGYYRHGGVVCK